MKTSELTGVALDWAVAKCEGVVTIRNFPGLAYIPKGKRSYYKYTPSTNWKQGGPILERERISVEVTCMASGFEWAARCDPLEGSKYGEYGPTPLIAAMRCYVASKLGDDVDIPRSF